MSPDTSQPQDGGLVERMAEAYWDAMTAWWWQENPDVDEDHGPPRWRDIDDRSPYLDVFAGIRAVIPLVAKAQRADDVAALGRRLTREQTHGDTEHTVVIWHMVIEHLRSLPLISEEGATRG